MASLAEEIEQTLQNNTANVANARCNATWTSRHRYAVLISRRTNILRTIDACKTASTCNHIARYAVCINKIRKTHR